MLLSVDPGLRDIAIARFDNKTLAQTYYVSNPEKKARGPKAWLALLSAVIKEIPKPSLDLTIVFETMDVYATGKARSSDLLELVGVEGVFFGFYAPLGCYHYLPKEWKGQVPKPIHNKRVEKTLNPKERTKILGLPASTRHNVIDAVGIGLYHLGRM